MKKMKGIVSSILAMTFAAAIAIIAPGGEARADGGGLVLGFLTCSKTGPGDTYVVFSKIPVDCIYSGVGGEQNYSGISGILLGVDLEIERNAIMLYMVVGGTSVQPGGLTGSYVGGKASVTIGAGPAVQGGLAGVGNGFELVPIGLGGQVGVGFTGGLGYLQIHYVSMPVAAPPPPAPPPPPMAAPMAQTFIVFFDFDKATLTAAGRQIVDTAAAMAKQNMVTHIQANGYTDTSGTKRYNLALSRRRADAIRAALVADGIPANRIGVAGYGEENLRVPTPDGIREPQNRRVEIMIAP